MKIHCPSHQFHGGEALDEVLPLPSRQKNTRNREGPCLTAVTTMRKSETAAATAVFPYTTACSPNRITFPGADATTVCSSVPAGAGVDVSMAVRTCTSAAAWGGDALVGCSRGRKGGEGAQATSGRASARFDIIHQVDFCKPMAHFMTEFCCCS